MAAALVAFSVGSFQVVTAGSAAADPVSVLATPTCSKSITYQGALVPASSTNSVNCNMQRGNVSDAVARLQDTMNDCYRSALTRVGVYPLSIDRNFGGNTEKALREVQRVAGTSADGVYGPNTRKAMLHVDPDYGDPCRRVS
ncbi:peptidoglycan-binding domain-containing protein [Micromonospora sp. WMMD1155]|uniref:peptidoglycan-binding domain-containing protein n=1 Tax=Micromonospora sp. WMMD1155 TaxID=3016094 RepID=UPI002499E616|nr:peptidoglycan-binding domain-containing protein [Micromonospora sp. WMMD1155]WFE50251.1 peptidoglycan-binding domain-containing protein [Micromonospora sp. WMMD1155]